MCHPRGSQGGLRIVRGWGFRRGPPDADIAVGEGPLEIVFELSSSARLANAGPRRLKYPSRCVLNSPIISMTWEPHSTGSSVLGLYTAQSIIDHWSPFNQRDTSVANMHDLYPISHCIPVAALSEKYFISFLIYLNNKLYKRVAKDRMHMRNHDFNEVVELVCSDFLPSPTPLPYFIYFLFFECFLFASSFTGCHYHPEYGAPA